jgi:hypothetical protein
MTYVFIFIAVNACVWFIDPRLYFLVAIISVVTISWFWIKNNASRIMVVVLFVADMIYTQIPTSNMMHSSTAMFNITTRYINSILVVLLIFFYYKHIYKNLIAYPLSVKQVIISVSGLTVAVLSMIILFNLIHLEGDTDGYYIRHTYSSNYTHDGISGKKYDGIGVTVHEIMGNQVGNTLYNERIDRLTLCNLRTTPINASLKKHTLYWSMHGVAGGKYDGRGSSSGLDGSDLNPGMCMHTNLTFKVPVMEQSYVRVLVEGLNFYMPIQRNK